MITVVTPTIAGREGLLAECMASVERLNLPHLVALDEHREGPAVIRNRLVELVATEWVLFLDDDDLLLPHYVSTVERHLADADVVYTDWHLSGAEAPLPYPTFDPDLLRRLNFIPVTACVRTEAFRAVGGFPNVRLEDHGLWLALLEAGYRFIHVGVTCWRYRRLPGSRNEQAMTERDGKGNRAMATKKTPDELPIDDEEPAEDVPAFGDPPAVDGDAMSAPDQLEAQQLLSQREDAVARGAGPEVDSIDARLRALVDKQQQ